MTGGPHDEGTTPSDQSPERSPLTVVEQAWICLPHDWQAVICGLIITSVVLVGVIIPW